MKLYYPGALFADRYEVAGRPWMGGMGIVYPCLDHGKDGQPVALKTFKPEYLPDRAARDRFLREGTLWVNLGSHPHIVRCYGVERIGDGREVYIVLELVAAEQGHEDASLRSWLIPGKPLPISQALLFGLQIVWGLRYATQIIPGFVHRDLKPENVLVGADRLTSANVNRVRVTDLGIASGLPERGRYHAVASGSVLESSDAMLVGSRFTRGIRGTSLYMAPEQWTGGTMSMQTDMYSLGCILFEMLCGKQAVTANSLSELEQAHCQGHIRQWSPSIPKAVAEVLSRCLSVKAAARYASWDEVEETLAAVYTGVVGQVAPVPEQAKMLERDDRMATGWAYHAIGSSYLDIGKANIAVGYFNGVVEAGRTDGERALEAAGLNGLGIAYRNLGAAQPAVEHHVRALSIAREMGDRQVEAAALGSLGLAYALFVDAQQAINYCEQSLTIAREIGDRQGEGANLGNLGLAYASLGQVRRAIIYFEKALQISREIGHRRGEGNLLGNLGKYYRQAGDLQQGLAYSKQAIAIFREIGARKSEGEELSFQGGTYALMHDIKSAVDCWQQGLWIANETGDLTTEGNCSYKLAVVFVAEGRLFEAQMLAQRALSLYTRVGRSDWARDAAKLIARIGSDRRDDLIPDDIAQQAFKAFRLSRF